MRLLHLSNVAKKASLVQKGRRKRREIAFGNSRWLAKRDGGIIKELDLLKTIPHRLRRSSLYTREPSLFPSLVRFLVQQPLFSSVQVAWLGSFGVCGSTVPSAVCAAEAVYCMGAALGANGDTCGIVAVVAAAAGVRGV